MAPLHTEAMALLRRGAWSEAEGAWRKVVAENPDDGAAWCHLGGALFHQRRLDDALNAFDRSLTVLPGLAVAHYMKAAVLHALRRGNEALNEIAVTLSIENMPQAHCLAGQVLFELSRLEESLAEYELALAGQAGMIDALLGCGAVLRCLNRPHEAKAYSERVIALAPDFALGHFHHGWIAYALDERETALADFEKAYRLDPGLTAALMMQAELKSHLCQWDIDYEHLVDAVRRGLDAGELFDPFVMLGFCDDAALHKRIAERTAIPLQPAPRKGRSPERLRIVLLSPDFRDHAVGWQIAELIDRFDKSRFEVAGICTRRGPTEPDPVRERLRNSFSFFGETVGLSNQAIAERLAAAGTAIAIDLALFTEGGRHEILSYRPAAVTAQWLGFPGTSGTAFIDYVIADKRVIPDGAETFYSEKIVRLPGSFMPLDTTVAPGPVPSRSDLGLPEEAVVFSAFNRPSKITPQMFARWMKILAAVPGSILWMTAAGPARDHLLATAAGLGIDPARLIFADRTGDRAGYFARLGAADLYLDSFPYGGHATVADHLWAGVPVITAPGQSFASRVAASMLTAAGVPELIAQDAARYQEKAVFLANDGGARAALKSRLIAARQTAPLFDMTAMARAMEQAFLVMWERRSAPPEHIDLTGGG